MFRRRSDRAEQSATPVSREYADLDAPLTQTAELGLFDRNTRQFRENLGRVAAEAGAHAEHIERALEQNRRLHESLNTAVNHALFLDFFDKLRASLAPSDQLAENFSGDAHDSVYGSETAFRAQATQLRILSTESISGRFEMKRLPVWVVGKRLVPPQKRKLPPTAEYLAVAVDKQIPRSVRNLTNYHEGYGRHFHYAMERDGFLAAANDTLSYRGSMNKHSDTLRRAISIAITGGPSRAPFGLIQFSGPAELDPVRLTSEDVLNLKRGKKNSYKIHPAIFASTVDEYSVNAIGNVRPAQVDDVAMERFNSMHYLTQIADAYGLMNELGASVETARTGRNQADEHVQQKLRQTFSTR